MTGVEDQQPPPTTEWHPDRATLATWNVLALALLVVGLVTFGVTWAMATGGGSFSFEGANLLLAVIATVTLTLLLMALHEGVHGVAIRACGARPQFGSAMMGGVVPVLYATAPGAWFTRRQFTAIALSPAVVLTAAAVEIIAVVPYGGWLVVPAAIHLGGCVGDFGMTAIVARQPLGTMVEDLKTGMRFHRA